MPVPDIRIRPVNQRSIRADGEYVLYWIIAARRLRYNFALDRAVEWARQLDQPLVILEALRCDYPRASLRLHQFVIEGMADTARRLAASPVRYYPYVERRAGDGKGLLACLGSRASIVITDDFPCFFLPRMVRAAGRRLDVRLEQVDSNGLLPVRAADRAFSTARAFRRFLQSRLINRFEDFPAVDPLNRCPLPRLKALAPAAIRRWPPETVESLEAPGSWLTTLPIDQSVAPAAQRGGNAEARRTLRRFVDRKLVRYALDRNHPDLAGTSRLSPYLHFGHIGTHEIFHAVAGRERWTPSMLGPKPGEREGWWGVLPGADAFLDELIVWRELAFNASVHLSGYDRYQSLPEWARATLARHAGDRRPVIYTRAQLEGAATHDEVWNAAQRQLVREGWFHGYLRMLWGKKILEWSGRPQQAVRTMAALMETYSLDGRDPNSYAGYFWVLGRYDHPWPPDRSIFGLIRYMSSANTKRKLKMKDYLAAYGATGPRMDRAVRTRRKTTTAARTARPGSSRGR